MADKGPKMINADYPNKVRFSGALKIRLMIGIAKAVRPPDDPVILSDHAGGL